jgi:hypothetical protein
VPPPLTPKGGGTIAGPEPADDDLEELGMTREQYVEKFMRVVELAHGFDQEKLN